MSLRIISGTAKGRKLKDVPGNTTRPVTDMVKEALFNILAGNVQDFSLVGPLWRHRCCRHRSLEPRGGIRSFLRVELPSHRDHQDQPRNHRLYSAG